MSSLTNQFFLKRKQKFSCQQEKGFIREIALHSNQKGRITLNEPLTKIPGTTYYIQFGIEGKYYAIFLIRGRQAIQSKQLTILRGGSLHELPEEVESGLRSMLDAEEVYISPVVVDRVVNELLEQVPQEGEMDAKEPVVEVEKRLVPTSISVQNIISKSDRRAGTTSTIEHHPQEKSKFDATSDGIGRYQLKKPKPLRQKEKMVEPSLTPTAPIKETVVAQTQAEIKSPETYISLDDKVLSLTTEINKLTDQVTKNDKEIKKMKRQITTLKKAAKEAKAATLSPE